MKDLLVIMGCSQPRGTMNDYLYQLKQAEIDVHIEDLNSFPDLDRGGAIKGQVDYERRITQQFSEYRKLVYTDAFDVTFYGTKDDVLRKIPDSNVLLGAERNCYPDLNIASRIEGTTPWRFVNGGLMAGTPENILKWLEGIENHPAYYGDDLNQKVFNLMLVEKSPLVPIDSTTELFYCLYGEQGELDFENGLPVNTLCNTHPNFIHANGQTKTDNIIRRREISLGHCEVGVE